MNAELVDKIKEERRWLEKSYLIRDYHHLQCSNHNNVRGDKWKLSDTSNALRLSIGYISESLKLAKMSCKYDLGNMTREKALEYLKRLED